MTVVYADTQNPHDADLRARFMAHVPAAAQADIEETFRIIEKLQGHGLQKFKADAYLHLLPHLDTLTDKPQSHFIIGQTILTAIAENCGADIDISIPIAAYFSRHSYADTLGYRGISYNVYPILLATMGVYLRDEHLHILETRMREVLHTLNQTPVMMMNTAGSRSILPSTNSAAVNASSVTVIERVASEFAPLAPLVQRGPRPPGHR